MAAGAVYLDAFTTLIRGSQAGASSASPPDFGLLFGLDGLNIDFNQNERERRRKNFMKYFRLNKK